MYRKSGTKYRQDLYEKLLCIVDTALSLYLYYPAQNNFLSIYLTEQPHTILSYYYSLVVGKVFSEALVQWYVVVELVYIPC